MKAYTENLHEELLSNLEELNENHDPRNLTDNRLGIIVKAIDQIKEKLRTFSFASAEDEIQYFKFVLPQTLALYFYYTDKIEWDRIIHQGSAECNYKFIDRMYSQAESFREQNRELYENYRDGKTGFDSFHFLRNSPFNRGNKYEPGRIIDPSSPPIRSELLARLIAYTRIEHELKASISQKDGSVQEHFGTDPLVWTGSKVGGSELIYAFKKLGVFNHGTASLKKIQEGFEKAFSVKLGNISKQFQEVLSRKTENSGILDRLKEALKKAIEEIDQKYFRKQRPPSGSPGSH